MLLFVWFCVVAQAFIPGGQQLAAFYAGAYEGHMRALVEAPQPVVSGALVGAAQHVTRYAPRSPAQVR